MPAFTNNINFAGVRETLRNLIYLDNDCIMLFSEVGIY